MADGEGETNETAASFEGDVVHAMAVSLLSGEAHVARLIVRPRQGELVVGAAQIQRASGRVELVSVLGCGLADPRFLPKEQQSEADQLWTVLVTDWEDARDVQGVRLVQSTSICSAESQIEAIKTQALNQAKLRIAAIEIMGALGADAPVESLLRALAYEHRLVRLRAAHALIPLSSRLPLEPFLHAIKDKRAENEAVREVAVHVLAAHPEDAPLDVLVELLQDSEKGYVRVLAAHACARLGPQAPMEALAEALRTEEAWGYRMSLVWALGALDEHALVEPLTAALDDVQLYVRVEAAKVLLRLGDRVPDEVMERARHIVEQHRIFEQQLRERDCDAQLREDRAIKPNTLDGWLAALNHQEWQTRASALRRIAELGERAPLDSLIAALRDDDPNVKVIAADSLASLAGRVPMDGRVTDALFAQLDDLEHDEEFAAAHAIEALAAYLPLGTLLDHLGDLNWYPRETALRALVELGPAAPTAPLVEALSDAFSDMRPLAAEALVKYHRDAFEPALREAERLLLGGSPGPVLGSLVQFDIAQRIGRCHISTVEAVGILSELLYWPHWQVRWQAIDSLSDLDVALPEHVVKRLRELQGDSQSSAVREAAAQLLERRFPM